MTNKFELLAPVGSFESLYAAVRNGANAVYLGGKLFNARAYASNFDFEELVEAVSYAHLHGVKVYITVNILLDDSEMEAVIDYIRYLYSIDVDAIIVQDLGLISIVREIFPDFEIHGSTQMTINNLSGVEFLGEQGFKRVVLARETPIEEIRYIRKNTSIELETFIHGALCVSYSGQCLMSSLIGGRSGNRGTCAQPCRMAYSIIDKEGRLLDNWDKKYILSPKDLNSLENMNELMDAGIDSFKIEGRMKRPEYVATVVNAYRKAIDKTSGNLTENNKKDVEQIFNRGFTKGLGLGDFGKSFISIDRPDNRGLLAGRVLNINKKEVTISLYEDIDIGDGIEFQLNNGEYKGFKSSKIGRRGTNISFDKVGNILPNSLVYKTSSEKLLKDARLSFEKEEDKIPIDMDIRIKLNEKPKLTIKYKEYIVESYGELNAEKSNNISLTKDKINEQLAKLGDTLYSLNKLNIELDENIYLSLSVLNKLRRDAILNLNEKIKNFNSRVILDDNKYNNLKSKFFVYRKKSKTDIKKLSIKVDNFEQFNRIDLSKLDRIYIGFYDNLEKVISKVNDHNKELYIYTDKILYQNDLEEFRKLISPISNKISGISVSNLGSIKYFKDNINTEIHGDIGLNLFNSFSVNSLQSFGISSFTLSPELNLQQIKRITEKIDGNIETIVYGYLPAMVTRNCPMAIVKNCKDDSNCKTCNFAKDYGLKDRKDLVFNMERKNGFSILYNSVPLYVLDNIDKIFSSGVNMVRLDFTKELNEISGIQNILHDYINNKIDIKDIKDFSDIFKQSNNITNGHYFRGIL